MLHRSTALTLALICTGLTWGCADKNAAAGKDKSDAECLAGDASATTKANLPKVKVVNAWCPLMMEHPIVNYMANPDCVREYRGMKVGFCCDDCGPGWDAMSEKDKATALAKARAKAPPKPQG
jgi:hypothetical protein